MSDIDIVEHTRSCPSLGNGDARCTCGLEWRIKLRTEQEMHAAWRKRAEEAEALNAKLRADLASARAKERERCAKVADKYHDALMRARAAAMEAGQQDAASILESRALTALGIAGTIRALTDEEQ